MLKRTAVALISFCSLVSFSSLAAGAAEWQVVADTTLGQLKMDRTSVTRDGKYTAAVLVYEFRDLQRQSAPPHAVFNKRQDNVLVDCVHPALGLQTSRFFEDDKLAHTQTREAANIRFAPPAPDSMAATVVHAVCAATVKTGR